MEQCTTYDRVTSLIKTKKADERVNWISFRFDVVIRIEKLRALNPVRISILKLLNLLSGTILLYCLTVVCCCSEMVEDSCQEPPAGSLTATSVACFFDQVYKKNSMKQSSSLEAGNKSATVAFINLSWHPMIHYRSHKKTATGPYTGIVKFSAYIYILFL